jgi:cation diffusion facilitator family transporter
MAAIASANPEPAQEAVGLTEAATEGTHHHHHHHHHEMHPCVEALLTHKVDIPAAMDRRAQKFAKVQNHFIDNLIALHEGRSAALGGGKDEDEAATGCSPVRTGQQAAMVSLGANLSLLIIKIVAVAFSNSLSVIATLVDSSLDLFSGMVFLLIARAQRKRERNYPVGKRRFEPLGVIFVASVMGTAALEVILISLQSIAQGPSKPVVDSTTVGLVAAVIAIKTVLYLLCRLVPSPSAQALAADHINDAVSNTVVLIALLLSDHLSVYADNVGAILVSLFIIVNWSRQGFEHVRNLAGHLAPPELLQKVTWVALHHSDEIIAIDTVRGYGFGSENLVEVDIVLDSGMPLNRAHNIGESLQQRIERIDGVERAFVHLDYCTSHTAADEHQDNYDNSSIDSSTEYFPHSLVYRRPQPRNQIRISDV